MNDDNVFEDAVMPDAGDMKEIEIYKAFRKWRAAQKPPTISEAYRAGYAECERASLTSGTAPPPSLIACRDLACDGSCGLQSVMAYKNGANADIPTELRCREFAAQHNLDAEKIIKCALTSATEGERDGDIKPHSSVIYTDLKVRCGTCKKDCAWHYLEDEDTIQFLAHECGATAGVGAESPSDEALEAIQQWKGDDFRVFFAEMKPIWNYSDPGGWCGWSEEDALDFLDRPVRRYSISTGGWSGNESIIGAMKRNYILWSLTWVQSRRGGHYIFEVGHPGG